MATKSKFLDRHPTARRRVNITQVSYGRTINTGNYESIRVDLTAVVSKNERWEDVMEDLRVELLRKEKELKGRAY